MQAMECHPDRGLWSRDSRTELGVSENGGVTRGIGKLGPRYTINPRGTPDTPEPSERETREKEVDGNKNRRLHCRKNNEGRRQRRAAGHSARRCTQLRRRRGHDAHKFVHVKRTRTRELWGNHLEVDSPPPLRRIESTEEPGRKELNRGRSQPLSSSSKPPLPGCGHPPALRVRTCSPRAAV